VTVEFGGGEVAMRFDGAVMVGITGAGLDRIVLGWAAPGGCGVRAEPGHRAGQSP
jgi:hypothetical protein